MNQNAPGSPKQNANVLVSGVRLFSIPALTAVIAGLLILISFAQPLADRLQLPYTVVLAMIGVAYTAGTKLAPRGA
jgi:hypothetical protein